MKGIDPFAAEAHVDRPGEELLSEEESGQADKEEMAVEAGMEGPRAPEPMEVAAAASKLDDPNDELNGQSQGQDQDALPDKVAELMAAMEELEHTKAPDHIEAKKLAKDAPRVERQATHGEAVVDDAENAIAEMREEVETAAPADLKEHFLDVVQPQGPSENEPEAAVSAPQGGKHEDVGAGSIVTVNEDSNYLAGPVSEGGEQSVYSTASGSAEQQQFQQQHAAPVLTREEQNELEARVDFADQYAQSGIDAGEDVREQCHLMLDEMEGEVERLKRSCQETRNELYDYDHTAKTENLGIASLDKLKDGMNNQDKARLAAEDPEYVMKTAAVLPTPTMGGRT